MAVNMNQSTYVQQYLVSLFGVDDHGSEHESVNMYSSTWSHSLERMTVVVNMNQSTCNNNNAFISIALFHVKHAQLP